MNPRSISDKQGNKHAIASKPDSGNKTAWKLLLIIPYLALCFPAFYARATPTVFGFPFFYWYQFLWVVLTSALLGFVYLKLKDPQND